MEDYRKHEGGHKHDRRYDAYRPGHSGMSMGMPMGMPIPIPIPYLSNSSTKLDDEQINQIKIHYCPSCQDRTLLSRLKNNMIMAAIALNTLKIIEVKR